MNVACLTPFSQGGKMTTENLHILQYTIMLQQYSRQIFFASPLQIGSIGNGGAAPIISTMLFCCTDRNRSTQIFQQFKGVTSVQKGFNSPIKLGKGGWNKRLSPKGTTVEQRRSYQKHAFVYRPRIYFQSWQQKMENYSCCLDLRYIDREFVFKLLFYRYRFFSFH